MATLTYRIALGIAAITVAGGAFAQAQVYRYTDADGRVVYSDRPPTTAVKNLQTKKLGSNFISTSEPGYAAALAAERFPVTLYTFQCGEACQNAESLLNKRGVPFTIVDVSDSGGPDAPAGRGQRRRRAGAHGRRQAGRQGLQRSPLASAAGRGRAIPRRQPPRKAAPVGRISDATPATVQEGTKAVGAPVRGGDYPK